MFPVQQVEFEAKRDILQCCTCHSEPRRPGQRNGLKCHALAQKHHRAKRAAERERLIDQLYKSKIRELNQRLGVTS